MIARLKRAAAAAALSALVAAVEPAAAQQAERSELTVHTAAGPRTFQVEIAETPDERATGLMYRRHLEPEHGMLFDFESDRPVAMWMRNTYIPLDMLFIDSDRRVKNIARRTTPLSERTVESAGTVRYVLEINGGLAETLGIAPGDVVSGPAIEE